MDLLTQFIAPVVSLWVIHNAIFSSAAFVNKMRETVISGRYDGTEISKEHGEAILTDWQLCIAATIFVCLMFTVIVVAVSIELSDDNVIRWVGFAIAFYTLVCAGGFLKCSIEDARLMSEAIARARPGEELARAHREQE